MKTITKSYEVYKFAELPEEAKQKALENYCEINLEDEEWWRSDSLIDDAKEYGIGINLDQMEFDLGRDNYLYFFDDYVDKKNRTGNQKGIWIEDEKKFLEGMTVTTKDMDFELWIDSNTYAGGVGQNFVETGNNYDEVDETKIQNRLKDCIDTLFDRIKADYEYSTSEEAIIETLEANDYDFTLDGKIFIN